MAHHVGRRTTMGRPVFALACLAAMVGRSPDQVAAGPDVASARSESEIHDPSRHPHDAQIEAAKTGATTPQGPAASECARLPGRMLERADPRIAFAAGPTTVSITLPGSDWCEIRMGPPQARTFVLVTPRVEARRAAPNATQWQMDFAALQAAPYRLVPGQTITDPETLRSRLEQALETGSSGQGIEGFIEFARRPGMQRELGPVDPRTRCVPLQVSGGLPASGANPPHARRFIMRARICLGPPGSEAALGMVFIQESTVGDPGAARRASGYDHIVERIFASLAFSAASPSASQQAPVSPACQEAATEFDQVFPEAAAMLRVTPEPGAAGAVEVAMGILVAIIEMRGGDLASQRRCFTEVLRARGFQNAPTFDAARDMTGRPHRPSTR